MVLKNVTIDDRDTNTIKYQGFWTHDGAYNATSVGKSGTLSSTNDPNANFTIDTPPIVAFYYFGVKRSRGGFYQICIDCYPENRQWLSIDGVNSTDDGKNPPVVLFSTNWPDPRSHGIIVTNRPDTRFPNSNSQITLDQLVYTIDDGSPAPAPSPLPSPSPPGKSNGTIIAVASSVSVIGTLLILFIVFLVLRWRRRRAAQARRNSDAAESEMAQTYIGHDVDPFFLSHDQNIPPPPNKPLKNQGRSSFDRPPGHQNSSSVAMNDTTQSLFYSQASASQSTAAQNMYVESTPRREEDAGSIHGLSPQEETLPPNYQDATRSRMTRVAS